MISQEELKRQLSYDPLTGDFFWINSNNQHKIAGSIEHRKDGYSRIRVRINGKRYLCSRLAWIYMTGEIPKYEIDHKDRNPLNNKFENLRDTPLNMQNRTVSKNKTMGVLVPGVYYRKNRSTYRIELRVEGKRTYFGSFKSKDEAETECIRLRQIHYPGNTYKK